MKISRVSFIIAVLVITTAALPGYVAAGAVVSPGSAVAGLAGLQSPVRVSMPVNQLSHIGAGLSAIGFPGSLAVKTLVPTPGLQGWAAPLAAPSLQFDVSKSMPGLALGKRNVNSAGKIGFGGPAAVAPRLGELLGEKAKLALTSQQLSSMSDTMAKTSADSIMNRVLGIPTAAASDDAVLAVRAGVIESELNKVLQPNRAYDVFVQLGATASEAEIDRFVSYVSQNAASWQRSLTGYTVKGLYGRDVLHVADFAGVRSIGLSYGPRLTGKVKWFVEVRGYGFITLDSDTTEVFVHFLDIAMPGFKNLRDGEPVELEVGDGAKGPQARRVIPLRFARP